MQLTAPNFKIGDQVYVKAKYFRSTRPSKKLSKKNLGPFSIISLPGTHSVTLKLPDTMHSIHPIFHPSQLKPSTPNTIPNHVQARPRPFRINDELEYVLAEILDSKINHRDQLHH